MTNAMVVYKSEPKKHAWARWMVGRTMRQNRNNLVSVVGKTGSGKTYSAIAICEIMEKKDKVPFTIDHIVFSLRELMNLINSDKIKKGSKIIFDEPQVSISAREFQSEANKVFNYLLSTFRHRNLTLFFCTPFESLLDKNTRRLFHAKFETISINPNKQTCRLKPRYIEYGSKPEPYAKKLIIIFKDKRNNYQDIKLDYWDIPKPSDEMVKLYEQKKLEFTNNLNKNISTRLKKYEESGKGMTTIQTEKEQRKPLTDKQKQIMEVLVNHQYKEASKILGISMSYISRVKQEVEKKGYCIQEFEKN